MTPPQPPWTPLWELLDHGDWEESHWDALADALARLPPATQTPRDSADGAGLIADASVVDVLAERAVRWINDDGTCGTLRGVTVVRQALHAGFTWKGVNQEPGKSAPARVLEAAVEMEDEGELESSVVTTVVALFAAFREHGLVLDSPFDGACTWRDCLLEFPSLQPVYLEERLDQTLASPKDWPRPRSRF